MRLAVMIFVAAWFLAWGADFHIVSIGEFTKDGASLVELSPDGKFFLTRGYRKIPNGLVSCNNTVFTVYDTGNRRLVRELVVDECDVRAVGFAGVHAVRILRQKPDDSLQLMEWDPISGTTSDIAFLQSSETRPVCVLDDKNVLGIGAGNLADEVKFSILGVKKARDMFQVLLPRDSATTALSAERWRDNCNAWITETRLLVPSHDADSLNWVSLDPSAAARRFRDFPGEQIYGYAISSDGKLIAVVTAGRGAATGPGSPGNPAFLHVDDAESGIELGKFQMDFPDKPVWRSGFASATKHLDNYHFEHQFARTVAISPDHSKVAVAYGVYSDPNGIGFFGLYSLSDGHRIATIKGDTLISGFWWAIVHVSEDTYARNAPLWGPMQFSPDSRVLYATSDHLHLWDVSGK